MIIDLCCGIGRWATLEEVVGIDSDPKTCPTILADVRWLPLKGGLRPRLVHASPPCTYFSRARLQFRGASLNGIALSMELVAACFRAFAWLEAEHWTLENPVGLLGRLLNQVKVESADHYEFKSKPTHLWSDMKGLRRAVIPDSTRQAILKASGDEGF